MPVVVSVELRPVADVLPARHRMRHEMPVFVAPMGTPVSVTQAASLDAERAPVHTSAQGWALHVLELRLPDRLRFAYIAFLVRGLAAAFAGMHTV